MHESTEEKSDDSKDSFYGELEQVFEHFPMYHMKTVRTVRRLYCKTGKRGQFQTDNGNDSLRQDSSDSGVRIINYVTLENLVVKSTMFPRQNIHKYTWTSPNGTIHNQIHHILMDRRWH
jgi:hypothetical protein